MADGAPSIETDRQLKSRAAFDSESFVQHVRLRPRRGGRLVFERLYLPLAGRPLHQSAASVILSAVQTTDSMASESTVSELARARRPVRKLQGENCVPLFRGGTHYGTAFSRDLAKVPVAGRDCILDFRFVPHRRDLH